MNEINKSEHYHKLAKEWQEVIDWIDKDIEFLRWYANVTRGTSERKEALQEIQKSIQEKGEWEWTKKQCRNIGKKLEEYAEKMNNEEV